jgi:3-oxoadipate enol-lactonase
LPTIDTGRISLHYHEAGTAGTPVLLVHELGGNHLSWRPLQSALSERWHTYAVDLRGYGFSEKPLGRREIVDYAADLAAFVEVLGVGRVDVVGAAMGAIIATALAGMQRNLVRRLVCIDGADAMTEDAKRYNYERAEKVRALGMRAVMAPSLANSFPEAYADLRRAYQATYLANDPVAYAEASEALCRMSVDFGRVEAPTLVITGAHDFIWPPMVGKALADRIKGARFEVLTEAGHFPHIQTPDQCYRLIAAFFDNA